MTAIWTTPKTWNIGELVTADALNEQVRDNLDYLKLQADTYTAAYFSPIGASPPSTTSTVMTNILASWTYTFTTKPGASYLMILNGQFYMSSGAAGQFSFNVDGANVTSYGGYEHNFGTGAGAKAVLCMFHVVSGLTAASHSFKPQWRSPSGTTLTLGAAAGSYGGSGFAVLELR